MLGNIFTTRHSLAQSLTYTATRLHQPPPGKCKQFPTSRGAEEEDDSLSRIFTHHVDGRWSIIIILIAGNYLAPLLAGRFLLPFYSLSHLVLLPRISIELRTGCEESPLPQLVDGQASVQYLQYIDCRLFKRLPSSFTRRYTAKWAGSRHTTHSAR